MAYSDKKLDELIENYLSKYAPYSKDLSNKSNLNILTTTSIINSNYKNTYPESIIYRSKEKLNLISTKWVLKSKVKSNFSTRPSVDSRTLNNIITWVRNNYTPIFDNLHNDTVDLYDLISSKYGNQFEEKMILDAYSSLALESEKWKRIEIPTCTTENKLNRTNYLAIDFETANDNRNSACAISLVKVDDNVITERHSYLIKPPSNYFKFSYLHKITRNDVSYAPTFDQLWPKISYLFRNVDFVVAHNVSFDRSVLEACCETYNIVKPSVRYECTVKIARKKWNIRPTKLNNVCDYFGIPLDHHEAGSDTLACAKIMLLSLDKGFDRRNINSLQLPVEKINKALLNWRTKRKQNIRAEIKKQTYKVSPASTINSTQNKKPLNQPPLQSIVKKEDGCIMTIIKLIAALILLYFFVKTCSPSNGRSPLQRNKIPSNKNINEKYDFDYNNFSPETFKKTEEYC